MTTPHPTLPARLALLLALALPMLGCAIAPLQKVSGGTEYAPRNLASKAAFDHGCPVEQVFLIRATGLSDGPLSTWDLEVCGKVHRYECLVLKGSGFACKDRTQEYPESSLPAGGPGR